MMEQLAERRMAREEDAKEQLYSASNGYVHPPNGNMHPHSHHGHNHPPPTEDEDYDDDEEDDEEYDSQDEDYDEEEMVRKQFRMANSLLIPIGHDDRGAADGRRPTNVSNICSSDV